MLQTATQANQAGATIPAPAFGAATRAQSLTLSMVGNGTNPGGVTTPAGWTRPQNVGQTVCGLHVAHLNSGFAAQTVTWGGTSASAFASGAVELGITPATAGVNATKLVGYAVLAPPVGVNATKLVGYAVLATGNTTPPLWGNWSFPDGIVGIPYDSGWDMPGSAEVVSYSVVSGGLPTGLSLAGTSHNQAHISGTPTVAGAYTFTLRATNVNGTVDKAFSITINAASGSGPSATRLGLLIWKIPVPFLEEPVRAGDVY